MSSAARVDGMSELPGRACKIHGEHFLHREGAAEDPQWVRAAPAIYITTADAAVRLREQLALEPPARCRADNPRRPAGSGWSCRLPPGPS
jgi:hypothetical protein